MILPQVCNGWLITPFLTCTRGLPWVSGHVWLAPLLIAIFQASTDGSQGGHVASVS